MERHGSETYFVLGEGLLGESIDGRAPTLAPQLEAATVPFRFSRMGPSGFNHQMHMIALNRVVADAKLAALASRPKS